MRKIFFILISILIAGSIIGFITIKNQSSSAVVIVIERSGSRVNQIVSEKDYFPIPCRKQTSSILSFE